VCCATPRECLGVEVQASQSWRGDDASLARLKTFNTRVPCFPMPSNPLAAYRLQTSTGSNVQTFIAHTPMLLYAQGANASNGELPSEDTRTAALAGRRPFSVGGTVQMWGSMRWKPYLGKARQTPAIETSVSETIHSGAVTLLHWDEKDLYFSKTSFRHPNCDKKARYKGMPKSAFLSLLSFVLYSTHSVNDTNTTANSTCITSVMLY